MPAGKGLFLATTCRSLGSADGGYRHPHPGNWILFQPSDLNDLPEVTSPCYESDQDRDRHYQRELVRKEMVAVASEIIQSRLSSRQRSVLDRFYGTGMPQDAIARLSPGLPRKERRQVEQITAFMFLHQARGSSPGAGSTKVLVKPVID